MFARNASFIAAAALLFACSGAPVPADTASPADPSSGDPVASPDPGGEPADGCSREIAIRCRAPFVDGCEVAHPVDPSRRLTTDHRCVDAQPSATPCEAEIALECGEGAMDSCLLDPAVGDVHFCVAI